MTDASATKIADILVCEKCDYKCCKTSDFQKHVLTSKHKNTDKILTNTDASATKVAEVSNKYICDCGKQYRHRQSLFNHKKKCETMGIMIAAPVEVEYKSTNEKDDLIHYLIKENQEFKSLILEIVKKDSYNNCNNTSTTNSHNKSFNLNFFLNETCKDAMNITDFVESIKLQLSDLERVGELGYVEGISNIIVKNLKELDVTQRPVHCTDKKRETMYVKDENAWEKDEEKKKMHKLVKKVADKNMRLLPEYRELHPDYIKASSLISDKYNQIFLESLGGSGDNNYEKEEKIIQKVSREVFVQKAL